jgi:hypothetical protein
LIVSRQRLKDSESVGKARPNNAMMGFKYGRSH